MCVYPNTLWYNREFVIHINLTTAQSINVPDVFHVSFGKISIVLPSFDSPWGQEWTILDIQYKLTEKNDFSNTFIVRMAIDRQRVKPNNFVNYIKKKVHRQWLLDLHNETVVLKSSFSTVSILPSVDLLSKRTLHENISESFVVPRFGTKYMNVDTRLSKFDRHTITKLYVCEQVELRQSEFILSPDNFTLYCYASKRLLFNGEFVITNSNTFDSFQARVCIEDSGLYKNVKGTRNIGTIPSNFDKYSAVLAFIFDVLYIRYQILI